MSGTVSWVVRASLDPDRADEFRALAAEMVAAVEADEPGTLVYEYFIADDASEVQIYERYRDDAAVGAHMANFGANFAKRFTSLVTIKGWAVYGDVGDDVRGMLAPMGARFLAPLAGFSRA